MRFQYTAAAQEVRFGPGELARLGEHLAALGVSQALLCTSGSYVRNGLLERALAGANGAIIATYAEVRPHVPDATVAEALALADGIAADMVIGLGGGSAVGTAKAVAVALADAQDGKTGRTTKVGAIPTTYSGSEMTPIFGVTRAAEGRKVTVTDARALPALVLYDPELTIDLPAELTAGTGINAMAHCIEGLYSLTRNPISSAMALAGITAIAGTLARCVADGSDLEARGALLAGAYLGGSTIAHVRLALHHGICHVLGGSAGVPHGVANAIMLPPVMRFNLPACMPELAAAGRAMGANIGDTETAAAARAITATAALIRDLGLPTRLRDAGVAEADLPGLADVALRSETVRSNPLPIESAAQIEALLRSAW